MSVNPQANIINLHFPDTFPLRTVLSTIPTSPQILSSYENIINVIIYSEQYFLKVVSIFTAKYQANTHS